MVQQRDSFLQWMLRVDRQLLSTHGVYLDEVTRLVPRTSLVQLWKLNVPPGVVVGWIAIRIEATAD